MATAPREQWSSRTGFILAAVGSAVGLGNMWRFAYLTAESGGAAFVLLYVVFTLFIGLPVMLAEFALGRGAKKGPIEALAHYGSRGWSALGGLFVIAGFTILAYYSVIAGWTLRYTFEAVVWGFPQDPGTRFGEITNTWAAVAWHVGFMALTVLTVLGGIRAGIERAALVLMPVLFLIVCGLAVYAATLEGGGPGYTYYLSVDLTELLNPQVLTEAAGQAFFSLSLGMGAMMTYASYLSSDNDLPTESTIVGFSDFGVAFVAGLALFPLIFALGLQEDVTGSTLGALFIALPKAFGVMGTVGSVVGIAFFVALVIGALTSAISLLQVVVTAAVDTFGVERHQAAIALGAVIAVIGIAPALDLDILGLMDEVAGKVFLVFGGALLAFFTGWLARDPIAAASEGAGNVRWFPIWIWLLRVPVPLVLGVLGIYTLLGLVSD